MFDFQGRYPGDPAPVVRVVRVPLEEFRKLQNETHPEDEGDIFIPRSPCTVYQPDPDLSCEEGPIGPDKFRVADHVFELSGTLHEILTAIWNYGAWEASYDTIRQRVYGDVDKTQFGNDITSKVLRDHVANLRPFLRPLDYDIECDGRKRMMRRVALT